MQLTCAYDDIILNFTQCCSPTFAEVGRGGSRYIKRKW